MPEVAVVALTASADAAEMEALREAGAVACLARIRSSRRSSTRFNARPQPRREPHSREHRDRPRLDGRLPDARGALPELARRAALRQLRRGELPRRRRHAGLRSSTPGCVTRRTLPTTSQPTPGDFLAVYEELGAYERDLLAAHRPRTLSGTFESAETAASELGDRYRTRRHRDRVGRDRDARARDPAPARARHDATKRSTSSSTRYRRRARHAVHRRHARVPAARRPDRARRRRSPAKLLNVKPILSIRDGEVDAGQARAREPGRRSQEFAAALEKQAATTSPRTALAVAHADAPERAAELEELVRERRPEAELELVATLGAVIGTHAGPGTVGALLVPDGVLRPVRAEY